MNFKVGCDLDKFKAYYINCGLGKLAKTEEDIFLEDPSHCILWLEEKNIIGHVIWHECPTSEHRKGDPRDDEDKIILESIFGKDKHLIELHEVWLKEEFRGKGYGNNFFEFFEDFILKKGFNHIVYYTDHPAAIAVCRNKGYKEIYSKELGWSVFGKSIR